MDKQLFGFEVSEWDFSVIPSSAGYIIKPVGGYKLSESMIRSLSQFVCNTDLLIHELSV